MSNFLKTLKSFRRNPFLNPWLATLRHGLWQIRKAGNRFPVRLEREGIALMAHREIRNGVGGLFNSAGLWDANNMRLVRSLAERKLIRNVADIGANVGVYTLIAGRSVPVVAFEPHPLMFRYLQENCDLNGLSSQVQTVQAAVGSQDGRIRFTDGLESSINRVITGQDTCRGTIEVFVHRADSWFPTHDFRPSLVKIDVEGHEEQVLEGFGDLLADLDLLLVECRDPGRIRARLDSAGLIGPFQYCHREHRFSKAAIHGEDWVHINPRFVPVLVEAGFCFDPEVQQETLQSKAMSAYGNSR